MNRRYIADIQEVQVNSANRTNGTDAHFTINLPVDAGKKFTHMCLRGIVIPKTFYNVLDGQNTFTLTENGVDTTITVPAKNYTRNSFKLILVPLLNLASPNLWTYSMTSEEINRTGDTGKYTYVVTGNSGGTVSFTVDNLGEQLGFTNGTTTSTFTASLLADNVSSLGTEASILVHCTSLQGFNTVLQSIYTSSANSYEYVVFENYNIEYSWKSLVGAQNNAFTFLITNEYGTVLEMNGVNIVFTLLFAILKNSEPPLVAPQLT